MSASNAVVKEQVPAWILERQPVEEEIIYPDSDGAPMGETEYHVIATLHLYDALRQFLKNTPDIYVAADMFLYYKEGDPHVNKAPDVMVVKGVPKHARRSFKTWEEGAAPCVIFEITSKNTQSDDTLRKSHVYAKLGVREYFVFDPLRDYIEEGLIGMRLEPESDEYTEVQPEGPGVLFSEELGVFLMVEEARVRIIDPQTHKPVPDLNEAIALTEQEIRRAEQEAQRAEQAEAEIARLRALLEQQEKGS
jgi:Uma2 family endonuclease